LDRADDACGSVLVPDGSLVVEQAPRMRRRTVSERIRLFLSRQPSPGLLDSPAPLRPTQDELPPERGPAAMVDAL
jgi:hypothetical protein